MPMSDDLKKMLEEERRRRLALTDRIARALAALDPDPDPGQIDGAVQYCRICRLLLERYRAAAALLEMDPQLLEEGGTVAVVLAVRSDVESQVETSGHNPILEAITALATLASKKS